MPVPPVAPSDPAADAGRGAPGRGRRPRRTSGAMCGGPAAAAGASAQLGCARDRGRRRRRRPRRAAPANGHARPAGGELAWGDDEELATNIYDGAAPDAGDAGPRRQARPVEAGGLSRDGAPVPHHSVAQKLPTAPAEPVANFKVVETPDPRSNGAAAKRRRSVRLRAPRDTAAGKRGTDGNSVAGAAQERPRPLALWVGGGGGRRRRSASRRRAARGIYNSRPGTRVSSPPTRRRTGAGAPRQQAPGRRRDAGDAGSSSRARTCWTGCSAKATCRGTEQVEVKPGGDQRVAGITLNPAGVGDGLHAGVPRPSGAQALLDGADSRRRHAAQGAVGDAGQAQDRGQDVGRLVAAGGHDRGPAKDARRARQRRCGGRRRCRRRPTRARRRRRTPPDKLTVKAPDKTPEKTPAGRGGGCRRHQTTATPSVAPKSKESDSPKGQDRGDQAEEKSKTRARYSRCPGRGQAEEGRGRRQADAGAEGARRQAGRRRQAVGAVGGEGWLRPGYRSRGTNIVGRRQGDGAAHAPDPSEAGVGVASHHADQPAVQRRKRQFSVEIKSGETETGGSKTCVRREPTSRLADGPGLSAG